ncbi:serine protease HTRA2, mitochondrial-like [Oppia nitens]|uniref:serine protease HTRA2, mitochondrial-like n=1 Tax=Oppia nitens TaxID=1686743 RepID=UPI0023D9D5B8|nr:serine protease HTRA2, mitochondrial-like [Oppia nitens]
MPSINDIMKTGWTNLVLVLNFGHNLNNGYYDVGVGCVIDTYNGLVITNSHVVGGLNEVYIQNNWYQTGRVPARVVYVETRRDLALLQLSYPKFTTRISSQFTLAAKDPEFGDQVISFGYPVNITPHPGCAFGLICCPQSLENESFCPTFIQHYTGITYGYSGGALVNEMGQLVGVNQSGNIIFHIDYATTCLDLIEILDSSDKFFHNMAAYKLLKKSFNKANHTFSNRPKLGVEIKWFRQIDLIDYHRNGKQEFGGFVWPQHFNGNGILVWNLYQPTGGNQNLRQFDIITKINDKEITSMDEFLRLIHNSFGHTLKMTVHRVDTKGYTHVNTECILQSFCWA